ncbi:hypothetical protein C8N35_10567 [Breoghania corrubedonensis]|uniref:Uncharacterized protein n=1 Tax=Breoghania corrubedonensis TaxID=665038 RepID=A0A2T5V8J4_9HYPH|nr:hypothetical protein [Breoghania corrubedonensis]PTW60067.1 hypothetical protein C8N35_10567 [Breoghania corrubedonensis]
MSETQKTISGRDFISETIVIDGYSLENCRFRDCRLVYRGGEPPKIRGCRFDACRWEFDGAAARTLQFLAALHQGGFESVVEGTFASIREMTPAPISASVSAPVPVPAKESSTANASQPQQAARMSDLARRLADFPPVRIIRRAKPKIGPQRDPESGAGS